MQPQEDIDFISLGWIEGVEGFGIDFAEGDET